jgi:heme/copper-type cytochrome/quinol oxidase subunit 2
MAEEFIARHRQADGSVFVDTAKAGAGSEMVGHSMPADTGPSTDIYMVVEKWSFDPSLLRLRAGVPYRFKLMAVDATHGAAFQLGLASHVIRLPKGVLVERGLVFARPGQHLLYCTVYCGEGHQYMAGQIEVV